MLHGPSGFEDKIAEYMKEEAKDHADKVRIDNLGNLIIEKGSERPKVMLAAHMDEIGFMVQHIDDNGFIKFVKIGGWDDRILLGMSVDLIGKEVVKGIIGTKPPHIIGEEEKKRPISIDEMFIDTGLAKDKLNEIGIRVGTPLVPSPLFNSFKGRLIGKAFDDRAGCALLLEIIKYSYSLHLFAVGTVQEEMGIGGARSAAYSIEPDVAIALEGTVAADTPNVQEHQCPTCLGKGPAITVMDKTIISNKNLVDFVIEVAEENKIDYQIKKPPTGATDAGMISPTKQGIPSCVISIPCRYIHSQYSLLLESDLKKAAELVKALLKEMSLDELKRRKIIRD